MLKSEKYTIFNVECRHPSYSYRRIGQVLKSKDTSQSSIFFWVETWIGKRFMLFNHCLLTIYVFLPTIISLSIICAVIFSFILSYKCPKDPWLRVKQCQIRETRNSQSVAVSLQKSRYILVGFRLNMHKVQHIGIGYNLITMNGRALESIYFFFRLILCKGCEHECSLAWEGCKKSKGAEK